MILGAHAAGSSTGAIGVSLSLSAADTIVDLSLQTQQSPSLGTSLSFGRRRRRLGGGAAAVSSTQFIIGHSAATIEPDWRAFMGWYQSKHEIFGPLCRSTELSRIGQVRSTAQGLVRAE